jgi:hypothetical protein
VVVDDASVSATNAPQLTWNEMLDAVRRLPRIAGGGEVVGGGVGDGTAASGGVVPSVDSVQPAPAPVPVERGLVIGRGKNPATGQIVLWRFSVAFVLLNGRYWWR